MIQNLAIFKKTPGVGEAPGKVAIRIFRQFFSPAGGTRSLALAIRRGSISTSYESGWEHRTE
jgi:hypothetical protein